MLEKYFEYMCTLWLNDGKLTAGALISYIKGDKCTDQDEAQARADVLQLVRTGMVAMTDGAGDWRQDTVVLTMLGELATDVFASAKSDSMLEAWPPPSA